MEVTSATPYDESFDSAIDGLNRAVVSVFFITVALIQTCYGPHWNPFKSVHRVLYFIYGSDMAPNTDTAIANTATTAGTAKQSKARSVKQTVGNALVRCIRVVLGLLLVSTVGIVVYSDKLCTQKRMNSMTFTRTLCQHLGHTIGIDCDDSTTGMKFASPLYTSDTNTADSTDKQQQQSQSNSSVDDDSNADTSKQAQSLQETLRGGHSNTDTNTDGATTDDKNSAVSENKKESDLDNDSTDTTDVDKRDHKYQQQRIDEQHTSDKTDPTDTDTDDNESDQQASKIDAEHKESTAINTKHEVDTTEHNDDDTTAVDKSKERSRDDLSGSNNDNTTNKYDQSGSGNDSNANGRDNRGAADNNTDSTHKHTVVSGNSSVTMGNNDDDVADDKQKPEVISGIRSGIRDNSDGSDNSKMAIIDDDKVVDEKHNSIDDAVTKQQQQQQREQQQQIFAQELLTQLTSQLESIANTTAAVAGSSSDSNAIDSSALQQAKDSAMSAIQAWTTAGMPLASIDTADDSVVQHELLQQAQAQVAAVVELASPVAVPVTVDGNTGVTDKTVTPEPTAAPVDDSTAPQQQQQELHQQQQQQPSKQMRSEQKAAAASASEAAKRLKSDTAKANKLKAKLQKSSVDLYTVITQLQSFAASSSGTAVTTTDVDTAVNDAQSILATATAILGDEQNNNDSNDDRVPIVHTDVAAIESIMQQVQDGVKIAKAQLNTFTSVAQAALKQKQQFDKQANKVLAECDGMKSKASDSSGNIVYAVDDVNTAIAACDALQTLVSSTDLSQWSVYSSDNSNNSAMKALAATDSLVKAAVNSVTQHEAAVRAQAQADADAAAKANAAATQERAKLNSVLSALKDSISTVAGVVESLKQLKASPQGETVAVPIDDSICELEKELTEAKLQVLEANETATVDTIDAVQKRVLLTANTMKHRLSLLTTAAEQADKLRATTLSTVNKLTTDVTDLKQKAAAASVEPQELFDALASIEALQHTIDSCNASQWTDNSSLQQIQSQLDSASGSLKTAAQSVQAAITHAKQQADAMTKEQQEQAAAHKIESDKQYVLIPKVLDVIDSLAVQVDALQKLAQSPIGDTVADDVHTAIAAATEVLTASNSTVYHTGILPTSEAMQTVLDYATGALATAVNDSKKLTATAKSAAAKHASVHNAVIDLIIQLHSINSTLATANEVHLLEVAAPQELIDIAELIQLLQQQLSSYEAVPAQWTNDTSVQSFQSAVEHVAEKMQVAEHSVTSAVQQAEQQKAAAVTTAQEQAKLIDTENANKAYANLQFQEAISSMQSTIVALQGLHNNTAAAVYNGDISTAIQQATDALESANRACNDDGDSTSADITAACDVLTTAEREAVQAITDIAKLMHTAEQQRLSIVKQVNKLDTKLQHIIIQAQHANVTSKKLIAATALVQTLQTAVTSETYYTSDSNIDDKALLSDVNDAAAAVKTADVSVTHAIAQSKQHRAAELKQAQAARNSEHATAAARLKAATALKAKLRVLETAIDAYDTFRQSVLGRAVCNDDTTINSVMATFTSANSTAYDSDASVRELSDMQTAVTGATHELRATTAAVMATAQRAVDQQAAMFNAIAALSEQFIGVQSNADKLLDVVANSTTDAGIEEQVTTVKANVSAANVAVGALKSSVQSVELSQWTSSVYLERVQLLQQQAESCVTAAAKSISEANTAVQLAVAAQRKAQKQHDSDVKSIESSRSWYTMLTHNAMYDLEQLLIAFDRLQRSPIGHTVTAAIDDAIAKATAALQTANTTLANSSESDTYIDVYEAHEAIAQAVASAASTLQELQLTAQQLHQAQMHATEQLNKLKSELSSIEQTASDCNITVLPSEVIAAQELIQDATAIYGGATNNGDSSDENATSSDVNVDEIIMTISNAVQNAGRAVSLASQAQLKQQQQVDQKAKQQAVADTAARQADIAAAKHLLQYPIGAIAALSTDQYMSTTAYLTSCANTTTAAEAAAQCTVLYIDANSSSLVMARGVTIDTISTIIWSLPLKSKSSGSSDGGDVQCNGCYLMLLDSGTLTAKQERATLWSMKAPTAAAAAASKQKASLQLHITAHGELIVASNSNGTSVVVYSVIPVDANTQLQTDVTAPQTRTLADVVKATASAMSVGIYYIGWVAVTLALG
jgi:hypothetical protein